MFSLIFTKLDKTVIISAFNNKLNSVSTPNQKYYKKKKVETRKTKTNENRSRKKGFLKIESIC